MVAILQHLCLLTQFYYKQCLKTISARRLTETRKTGSNDIFHESIATYNTVLIPSK